MCCFNFKMYLKNDHQQALSKNNLFTFGKSPLFLALKIDFSQGLMTSSLAERRELTRSHHQQQRSFWVFPFFAFWSSTQYLHFHSVLLMMIAKSSPKMCNSKTVSSSELRSGQNPSLHQKPSVFKSPNVGQKPLLCGFAFSIINSQKKSFQSKQK